MDKEKLNGFIGREGLTLVEAMQKMDTNGNGILFIVNEDEELVGTLTDGDIRRWLIKTGGNLEPDINRLINHSPQFLMEGNEDNAICFMIRKRIKAVPILDDRKRIVDVILNSYTKSERESSWKETLEQTPVIIMAGGKGTRLYPYTKILPKPLIPIGDVPILERILNRFYKFGAMDFFLTVNYKKEMIKSYFSELKPPYRIHYVEETIPLGTAGGIRLLDEPFEQPVIVTNCDTLIEADYKKVMDHHRQSGNDMTIVSSLKNVEIPYGVLHSKEHGIITSMDEKPKLSYFINTGMYVVNPECLDLIPKNRVFHMTDLADAMMRTGKQVGMYPISEISFLDMGEFEEMKKMEERIKGGYINE